MSLQRSLHFICAGALFLAAVWQVRDQVGKFLSGLKVVSVENVDVGGHPMPVVTLCPGECPVCLDRAQISRGQALFFSLSSESLR